MSRAWVILQCVRGVPGTSKEVAVWSMLKKPALALLFGLTTDQSQVLLKEGGGEGCSRAAVNIIGWSRPILICIQAWLWNHLY